MSGQEVLNQDEIDALLNGVDAGAVSTDPPGTPGEARQYDFSREMRASGSKTSVKVVRTKQEQEISIER